jgi:hypothetical protein
MTSTEGGRKTDSKRGQFENAEEAKQQQFDGNSKVTERRREQAQKAKLWIFVTGAGIVIAVRHAQDENTDECNWEIEEWQSK